MLKLNCLEKNDELNEIAVEVFKSEKLIGEAVVELDFISEQEILELNKRTRDKDNVTDVLSFPTIDGTIVRDKPFNKKNYPFEFDDDEKAVILGNIVICSKRAEEQALEYGHSKRREVSYLFLHGLLHLLGYDHMNEDEKQEMRGREECVLNTLNIGRDN